MLVIETTNPRYALHYVATFDRWYVRDTTDDDSFALLNSSGEIVTFVPNAKGFKTPEKAIKFLRQNFDATICLRAPDAVLA